ncbi:MAG: hypothetical protein PHZ04_05375 [Patescibacteria group bacterium]|nr:hypothetical protein [Patescibacteria group bacterium]MDD5554863.1 hypothetical protein [Patescibacteria group bacterium]
MEEKNLQNENQEKEVDISHFPSDFGPSSKKLALGLWLIENKKKLRAALVIFLALVAGVSWSYTIYGFAYYLAKGMNEDEALSRQIVQTQVVGHDYILGQAPADLIFSSPQIFKGNEDKYDFLAEIKNPNPRHWASFSYCFSVSNKEADCGENFILPEETKIISALAKTFKSRPTNLIFAITKISWSRINPRQFPDWKNFRDEHLNIAVEGIKFTPASGSGLSEKLNLNSLEFIVNNRTPFNYWEVPFNILLYRGGSIMGINKYTVLELMSGEKRKVEMSWLGGLSASDNIKIVPEINILKDDIYIKYEGGIGEEK